MTKDPADAVDRLRERLGESDDIGDRDADAIRRLSDRIFVLGNAEYSDERHEFHLMRLVKIAETVSDGCTLDRALEDRDAAEQLVSWVNQTYDNPETNRGYRMALRMFGEHASSDDQVPPGEDKPRSLSWIPTTYPDTYDPSPTPSEMLHWEDDVRPMIDAAQNFRDAALAALAFDLGPRAGELFALTRGDITDHDYGLRVTLNGKNGQRSPVLVPSVPHVNRWLDVQSATGSDVPLWSRLGSDEQISNNRVRDVLGTLAIRADVDKPVTPTNFRKSSASHLASEGVSQPHLEDHHGWTRGSKAAARYISVFGEAADREVARAHGVDVSADESEPTAPLECPRCGRQTPREEPSCVFCGQAMSQSGLETVREQNAAVREVTAAASGDRAEALAELGDLFDRYPFLREAAGN
ncbi:tyrosine-type recombinase/integrase [Halococcus sp. PRR34]|uniref:tyrosine-type recombinase/integrase n=1 Tax=Halococcus sp. PRR34 TaxID=3020830 RepID=UPI00235F2382|nr:tyrosine-type recombinase/integrase [Halococcus sp. PRR34]